jgi:hypothetical protein
MHCNAKAIDVGKCGGIEQSISHVQAEGAVRARLQPSISLANASGSRIAESLSRNYDLALALFVAAVVALFVLPLCRPRRWTR